MITMVPFAAMINQFRKPVALVMFVIFMANVLLSGFHTVSMAHEIEHGKQQTLMMLSGEHFAAHHYDDADNADGAPSASDHQLLHAVDHPQLFSAAATRSNLPSVDGTVFAMFRLPAVPLASSESLFRPPRKISSIG